MQFIDDILSMIFSNDFLSMILPTILPTIFSNEQFSDDFIDDYFEQDLAMIISNKISRWRDSMYGEKRQCVGANFIKIFTNIWKIFLNIWDSRTSNFMEFFQISKSVFPSSVLGKNFPKAGKEIAKSQKSNQF